MWHTGPGTMPAPPGARRTHRAKVPSPALAAVLLAQRPCHTHPALSFHTPPPAAGALILSSAEAGPSAAYELVLAGSGGGGTRVLGSREFARYYRQRPRLTDGRASMQAAQVQAQYRRLAVPLLVSSPVPVTWPARLSGLPCMLVLPPLPAFCPPALDSLMSAPPALPALVSPAHAAALPPRVLCRRAAAPRPLWSRSGRSGGRTRRSGCA